MEVLDFIREVMGNPLKARSDDRILVQSLDSEEVGGLCCGLRCTPGGIQLSMIELIELTVLLLVIRELRR